MKPIFQFYKKEENRLQVHIKIDKDIQHAVELLESAIKIFTPVKTGNLQGSMIGVATGWAKGQVETNVEYAEAVEYGTGSQTDSPKGSNHPQWGGRRPRAMMRRGAMELEKKGVSIFK